MAKFSNKLKKTCFWLILGQFSQSWGPKKIFPENPALLRTTSHWILAPCKNLEKVNDTFPIKRLDRHKDGWTDGPCFIGPLWLPPGIQK